MNDENGLQRGSKEKEAAMEILASILEYAEDAIIGADLKGNIISWNKGAEEIYGYSKEEIVGKSCFILVPENTANDSIVIIEKIKRGEALRHYETIRRRKDGTLINVAITASPIKNKNDAIIGVSVIARDITTQKDMDRELKRKIGSLELFSKAAVGREMRMIELKNKVKELEDKITAMENDRKK